jgi:hypothetical protein
VLHPDEISHFVADGYVAVRSAIPPDVTRACQDIIWAELAPHGVLRDDPATWTRPVLRINTPGGAPFATAGTTRLVGEACDQLLGAGRWIRPTGVGGTIPVRFPSPDDPGDAGWHIEASYSDDGGPRVSLRSRGRGLLALYLFTDVGPGDAPTRLRPGSAPAPPRLRPGSHLDVPPILAPGGDDGMPWLPAAQQATFLGTHICQASITSSRVSSGSSAAIRACTQWNRWSDSRGSANLPGSAAIRASRSSLGNPNPIVVSSGDTDTYTIFPTRNFTYSRIRCSELRGSVTATARISSSVTTPPR